MEKFFITDLLHLVPITSTEFIFLHYHQIAIWNLIQHIIVCQIEIIHERRNLPQQAIITYCLCFAIRFATFFAKPDSVKKSFVSINE